MPLRTRPPRPEDAEAIARIYNEGIAGRLATFETRERTAADVEAWLDEGFPSWSSRTTAGRPRLGLGASLQGSPRGLSGHR